MQITKHIKQIAALMMVMMFAVSATGPLGMVGTAAATSSVSGTVTDSSGNAVGSATVEAVNSSGTVVASGTTASDGSYSLTGLSDSTSYTLRVTATGYDAATKSFSTGTGTSETVDVSLTTSTYTVSGTVTDSGGNAVSNVAVTIIDSTGAEVAQTTTASDGSYSISGVKHGDGYIVKADAAGYLSTAKSVSVTSATTVDFSITAGSQTAIAADNGDIAKVYAEIDDTVKTTVTVEAYTNGSWTVVDTKTVTPSSTPLVVEFDASEYAGASDIRVTVEGQPATEAGLIYDSSGGVIGITGSGSIPTWLIAAIVAGGAYLLLRD